jgi:hypothetical protein
MGCGREAKFGGGSEQLRCSKKTIDCPQFKARTMTGNRGVRNWGSFANNASQNTRNMIGNAKSFNIRRRGK